MSTKAAEEKQKLASFIKERLYMRLAAELGKRMAKGLITPFEVLNYSHTLIDKLWLYQINKFNYLIYENYCKELGQPIVELPLYTSEKYDMDDYIVNIKHLLKKIAGFLSENNQKTKTYSPPEIESMKIVAISIMQLGNSIYSPQATLTNLSSIFEGHVKELVEKNTGVLSFFKNPPIVSKYKEIITFIKTHYGFLNFLPPTAIKLEFKTEVNPLVLGYEPKPALIASNTPTSKIENSFSLNNISMQILGGFIAAIGCTAVALAFVVLNASTFGVAGIVLASIGLTAFLAGAGLFAIGTYKNCKKNDADDDILPFQPNLPN